MMAPFPNNDFVVVGLLHKEAGKCLWGCTNGNKYVVVQPYNICGLLPIVDYFYNTTAKNPPSAVLP